MRRDCIAIFLVFAVGLFGLEPELSAQYAPPSQGYPPNQGYPSAQPQYSGPQYGGQGYPQAQYPQSQYPQNQYPQNQYPQNEGAPTPQDIAADQQHGVARLSIVQGDVNVRRGDSGELVAAAMNAPLGARDRLQTSPGSRAEAELDYANVVRLGPDTDLGFGDLEYHKYQLQLGAGTIMYRVLRSSVSQAEIDTPSIAMRPAQQGEYRISVFDDGTTQIAVRSGAAEIFSPRGSQQLYGGQTMLVRGDPSNPQFQTGLPVARDQFDDWSEHRDQDMLASQSYSRVSQDIYGADDLDQYGRWVPSQYGQVWTPRVAADWSPYSAGHWVWMDYYGWTWVDDAPWGWAPYHYGRWFWNGGYGWSWWPGAGWGVATYWSPALVGFFGFGSLLSAGLWSGIGWVALAPFEICHPWWGRFGFGYRGGFGFERFGAWRGNFAGFYRNAAIRGGAMTARYDEFGSHWGRFNAATREQLAGASLYRGQMPIRPSATSYRFANRVPNANPRLAAAANRTFFQRGQFAGSNGYQRSGFGNRVPATQSLHGVAPNMQNPNQGQSGFASGRSNGGGWQRFGDPGGSSAYRQGFAAGNQSGWHNFGQPQHAPQPSNGYGTQPYRGNSGTPSYQSRPGGNYGSYPRSGFGEPRNYSAPRFSSPSPQYSAPHYSAPSYSGRGGGSEHFSQPHSSGGGGSSYHSNGGGGGGGHSSGGGRSSGGGGHRR
ncbi:MAG: FecR domain-containing protein [Acidobacteriia bacterium]|nr:FecR domain-containing protein [Terriglobia bacterium]